MFSEMGHAVNEITDALGEAFRLNDAGNKIQFHCVPSVIPNDILNHLEKFGVYAKPASAAQETDSGRTCSVYVRPKQFWYAAGLIAGYAPGSVKVLQPRNPRPIRPGHSWGRPVQYRGFLAGVLRLLR